MVPPRVLANPSVRIPVVIGFAFMVCFYGMPFVISLYFQQERGLSALATGALFVPMMLIGAILTPFSPRIAERVGQRLLVVGGLLMIAAGLITLGLLPVTTSVAVVSAVMVLLGLGGPFVMPATTAVLLNNVRGHEAGIASGVFNTSRQIGGGLAIAVFGGLLANRDTFMSGMRGSLLIGAAVAVIAALVALRLRSSEEGRRAAPGPA
jgi:MFS family permease